jgi:hypothetical protein
MTQGGHAAAGCRRKGISRICETVSCRSVQRNQSLGILDIFRRTHPHETIDFAVKPFLGGHGKVLKRDETIITASTGEHKGCNDAQATLFNGCSRNCCCSTIGLVACRQPPAGDASCVDQPHRHDDELPRSTSGRAVGRHLIAAPPPEFLIFPSKFGPGIVRGFLFWFVHFSNLQASAVPTSMLNRSH